MRLYAACPWMSSPSKRMLPFLVPQRPGDAIDERALARAVRADEADPLARVHEEIDARRAR